MRVVCFEMVHVEVRYDDEKALVLAVAGELGPPGHAVDEFCQCGLDAIAEADGRPVIIDAAAVTFIDSTGLSALITLNKAAAAAGTVLTLRAVPPRMASLLRITALDTMIPVIDKPRGQNGPPETFGE
jgi:anti-sigma B factor antagonist